MNKTIVTATLSICLIWTGAECGEVQFRSPDRVGLSFADSAIISLREAGDEEPSFATRLGHGLSGDDLVSHSLVIDSAQDTASVVFELLEQAASSSPLFNAGSTGLFGDVTASIWPSGTLSIESLVPSQSSESGKKIGASRFVVWICRDSRDAAALAWSRRGGTDRIEPRVKKREEGSMAVGEGAYWDQTTRMFSVSLPESDSRSGKDRIGMIRGNVVVEVVSGTYSWSQLEETWVSNGLSQSDAESVFGLLADFDARLNATFR